MRYLGAPGRPPERCDSGSNRVKSQIRGGGNVFPVQALRKRGDPRALLDLLRAMPPDEELAASIDKVDEAHRKDLRMV